MTKQELIAAIESESRRQVVARLGYTPHTWYTGGSSQNDYRLFAEEAEDGRIKVSDTSGTIEYLDAESCKSDEREVGDYVRYWLDETMPAPANRPRKGEVPPTQERVTRSASNMLRNSMTTPIPITGPTPPGRTNPMEKPTCHNCGKPVTNAQIDASPYDCTGYDDDDCLVWLHDQCEDDKED